MISAIIIGLIVGATAKILMPGKDPAGWIITCLLGVMGSFVAHVIGTKTGYYMEGEPAGFAGSIMGALFILFLYRILMGRTHHSDKGT
ncbi:MAG: GlsB/YeaQ/YmgE family stress response membrane protein [Bdellovibrio sp.]|nr:GlsB/YeaQ/YmgE family stress response membrane protein [Bdellovibrio sp.]